uniref:Uncharacterized protein n=1 Tax=Romanomermis culicivorax TaxID=13658 RepID=A0A915I232_ROMCU
MLLAMLRICRRSHPVKEAQWIKPPTIIVQRTKITIRQCGKIHPYSESI